MGSAKIVKREAFLSWAKHAAALSGVILAFLAIWIGFMLLGHKLVIERELLMRQQRSQFSSAADLRDYLQRYPDFDDLSVENSPNITVLPSLPDSLKSVVVDNCSALIGLPRLPGHLRNLYIGGCPKLASLPDFPRSLPRLLIYDCEKLKSLPDLPLSLDEFELQRCDNIESLPPLPPSLHELRLWNCARVSLPAALPRSLRALKVDGCPNCKSLPPLPSGCIFYWGQGGRPTPPSAYHPTSTMSQ